MTYEILRRSDLDSPSKMEPAVILYEGVEGIARRMDDPTRGVWIHRYITHGNGSSGLLLRVGSVPLAFVSYDEQPGEAHVLVKDDFVGKTTERLEHLLASLPISGIKGHWWQRDDQAWWPGNGAGPFVVMHSYSPA